MLSYRIVSTNIRGLKHIDIESSTHPYRASKVIHSHMGLKHIQAFEVPYTAENYRPSNIRDYVLNLNKPTTCKYHHALYGQ